MERSRGGDDEEGISGNGDSSKCHDECRQMLGFSVSAIAVDCLVVARRSRSGCGAGLTAGQCALIHRMKRLDHLLLVTNQHIVLYTQHPHTHTDC